MAYPVWQPGTLYQPGDIVIPITAPAPSASAVVNGDFSAGATGWDFSGDAFYTTGRVSKSGFKMAVELPGNRPSGLALNQTRLVVPVGKKITATCQIDQGASIKGATRGWVEVHWFNSGDVLLRVDKGNQVDDGSRGEVHPSTCESIAPEGAAYCRTGISLWSVADHSHSIWGGALQVQGTFAGLPADLAYRAVQPESGFSDSSEPAWPPVLGQRVVDNEVTWEAISATRVVWTAEPLYVSGDEEPEWPEDEGAMVKNGSVLFRAVSRRVEDPNCPNTKIVAIAASKVFCGDGDIVRYSATVNPLDWSSDNDAGYLPTGLQNYGSNPVEAMGLYRGNLIAFNAEAFQLWQVDEDPANMALLDALPMGSTQHHAIAPVSNDLFFLASQGVRTVGIAASSTNFQAGDVGMPIDPLVQAAMSAGREPLALYYPAMGQYWLVFNTDGHWEDEVWIPGMAKVFVYSMTRMGQVGAWSRYEFPFAIDDWAIAGDALHLRSGDFIHLVDEAVIGDEIGTEVNVDGGEKWKFEIVPFKGVIQWPWLEFGQPGVTKILYGFDIVGQADVSVSFGIDQSNGGLFTPGYTVPADTVPGMVIPMPLAAPSLSVRLTYDGSEPWQWNALGLYLQDMRSMA
ncbi:hypothetical protein [Stenotrophomonas sp. PS02297]|uniref:hypothetical protein n=1 Tax=Stenotrophomonas sp. PS02297 TaxID=2991423 RepID=UPI00249C683D|nr:hypothetical protein [Stenotrophomonas sp. PS02297]